MKESKIEADCRKLAIRMGYVVYKGSGRIGAPDRVFLRNGRCFTVEFKRSKGGVQQPNQIREQKYLQDRGVDYYLVNTREQFRQILIDHEESEIT